jgi:hypothetical protein
LSLIRRQDVAKSTPVTHPALLLLHEARRTLVFSQGDLANLFGVARRTVQRWDAAGATPDARQLGLLARAVFPKDADLAARLAGAARTSLQELGLVPPELAASPPPAPVPPLFVPPLAHLVDSIACAAADAIKLTPDAVRPALLAAFARARDLRLAPEAVARSLAPPEPKAKKAAR